MLVDGSHFMLLSARINVQRNPGEVKGPPAKRASKWAIWVSGQELNES